MSKLNASKNQKQPFVDVLKVSLIPQEDACVGVFFNKVAEPAKLATLIKEISTQLFYCEICEIFKHTFFYKTPPQKIEE